MVVSHNNSPLICLTKIHLDELIRAWQQMHESEPEPDLIWCSVGCRFMTMKSELEGSFG